MESELKKIKKLYGEAMAKFCRETFPIILEEKDKLLQLLIEHFEPTHSLYKDLLKEKLELQFKNYIYSLVEKEKNMVIATKSPTELIGDAGYDLYECKTEEEIQSFRKYYAPGEELCTFWTQRLNRCIVFFAVKKNVNDIKREDFINPQRQDEYGTSVISIQFTKDDSHILSIKNRYNHTVNNPDATFGNNLDNIITGLTSSFEEFYNLHQKNGNNKFEIPGYVIANDGKYYKYNNEINNIYYCPNNIIIDNFNVKQYDKEKYLVFDYFLLDLVNKKIISIGKRLDDSFVNSVDEIKKIQIKKDKNIKIITITSQVGEDITIKLNQENCIMAYKNPNMKVALEDFLIYCSTIKEIELENIELAKRNFLRYGTELRKLTAPKLKEVGNCFLKNNKMLEILNLESLEKCGDTFLHRNEKLYKVNLPNLVQTGNYFLQKNSLLIELNLPNLKFVGDYFLEENNSLKKIYLPKLIRMESHGLYYNTTLEQFYAPNASFGYAVLDRYTNPALLISDSYQETCCLDKCIKK